MRDQSWKKAKCKSYLVPCLQFLLFSFRLLQRKACSLQEQKRRCLWEVLRKEMITDTISYIMGWLWIGVPTLARDRIFFENWATFRANHPFSLFFLQANSCRKQKELESYALSEIRISWNKYRQQELSTCKWFKRATSKVALLKTARKL